MTDKASEPAKAEEPAATADTMADQAPAAAAEEPATERLSGGMAYGIGIGVLLALLILAVAVWFFVVRGA